MKNSKKTKGKRLLALLIAAVVCLTAFPLAAFAADLSSGAASLDIRGAALGTVDNQEGETVEWISGEVPSDGISLFASGLKKTGTLYTLYQTSFPHGSPGATSTWGTLTTCVSHMMDTDGVYNAAYCIDQDLGYQSGASHTTDGTSMADVSVAKQKIMGFILANGFQWSSGSYWSQEDNDKWLATQLLIWATMKGRVTLDKKTHLISVDKSVQADIVKISPKVYSAASFVAYYNSLVKKLENARRIPSFCTYPEETVGKEKLPEQELKPITLKGNGSAYTASANDKNGVLKNFNFTGKVPGVTATTSGNTLKLSTSEEIGDTRKSSVVSYKPQGGENAVLAYRYAPAPNSYQRFACYTPSTDPVSAILAVSANTISTVGQKIIKTSEDDIVSGISFTISGGGKTFTKTTDANGEASLSDLPKYEKKAVLDEDGEPMEDEDGNPILEDDLSKPITYTVKENTPVRYVDTPAQSFTPANGGAVLEFENRLKKWRSPISKVDAETGGTPQGDAALAGAIYGLYDSSGNLLDTYTTDSNHRFMTEYYPCGTGYYLQEIAPSTGYLLNTEKLPLGIDPSKVTEEYNTVVNGAVTSARSLAASGGTGMVSTGVSAAVKLAQRTAVAAAAMNGNSPEPTNTVNILSEKVDGFTPVELTIRDENKAPRADLVLYVKLQSEEFIAATDSGGKCGILAAEDVGTANLDCQIIPLGQYEDGAVTAFDKEKEALMERFMDGGDLAADVKTIHGLTFFYDVNH